MDLYFVSLYILLCLALASECHWLVVHCLGASVLLYTAARVLYIDRCTLTHVDLRYYIPNILLCLAFASECHVSDVSDLPTAVCFAIAGCALNYMTGAAVYCAGDIFPEDYTSGASALFSSESGMSAYMSKITMKAMRKITLRRFYQAVAVLCQLLVLVYLASALLFAAYTIMAVAQAVQVIWAVVSSTTPESISFTYIYIAGGLCLYIPAIFYFCRHLLADYIAIAVPMTCCILALAGEITIPAYSTLWAVLICGQACLLVRNCMGAIGGGAVGIRGYGDILRSTRDGAIACLALGAHIILCTCV